MKCKVRLMIYIGVFMAFIISSIITPSYTGSPVNLERVTKEEKALCSDEPNLQKKKWLIDTLWQSPEFTKGEKIVWDEPSCANIPIEKYTRARVEYVVYEEQKKKLEAEMREYFISLVEEAERITKEKKIREAKKRKAARRRVAKKQAELKKLKSFFESLNTEDTDMSQRLGLSKDTYEKVLNALTCDYAGLFKENATFMWQLAKDKDFNEFLIVGIIANESYWGKSPVSKNNFSSQRIGSSKYYQYETAEEGIEVLAVSLAENYLDPEGKYYNGTFLKNINELYCEPLEREDGSVEKYGWAQDVSSCIKRVIKDYLDNL